MQIRIERITDDDTMNRAFGATVGRGVTVNKSAALHSEHSPIRCLWYWIEFSGIPQRVVNHLTRHKHGVEWFVATSRPDRISIQPDMRDMACMINAQALISISRKRLCLKAWCETVETWEAVRDEMLEIDPDMAAAMRADCMYRGRCHEMQPCRRNGEVNK